VDGEEAEADLAGVVVAGIVFVVACERRVEAW
jgi:hypothetical protein